MECKHERVKYEQKGQHLGEYCADCGKWLCWCFQGKGDYSEFKMPFGKHKDKMLKDIPIHYLKWAMKEIKSQGIFDRIQAYLKASNAL